MSKYLGIDLGTQSLKVLIYNAESKEVEATASSELALRSRPDGTREQEANWWLDALHAAMAELSPSNRDGIAAIGVSGQQHGFTPLGADGRVLAPVKLWCDTSTTA
ncbi:MAG: FGGY family carbohydrate kinase, partial [Halioglobus sp.]